MRQLHQLLPDLIFPSDLAVWPTVTFNGGPQTATFEHADVLNQPGVPCGVHCLGYWNAKKSARFIMHDFRLYVDFPPNRTVIISSAGVRHSNTALEEGDRRYSIAMYMSGALMRYAAFGGNVGGIPADQRARLDQELGETWVHQYARLSNFWDLEEDRRDVFERSKGRASVGAAGARE